MNAHRDIASYYSPRLSSLPQSLPHRFKKEIYPILSLPVRKQRLLQQSELLSTEGSVELKPVAAKADQGLN